MHEFSLTTTHLRFVCQATTPLRLEADTFRAGSNLRGALGQVMLRTYCAEPHPQPLSSEERGEHAAHCPVHWLLVANMKPGEERRGYTLTPPLPSDHADCGDIDHRNAGDSFEFGLTLFGNAAQFLPYFILAVPEMGRMGIGPGRGKFELKRVWALNPLTGESEILFGDAGNVVRTPTLVVNHAAVMRNAEWTMDNAQWSMHNEQSAIRNLQFAIDFLTPMRLIENGHMPKTPEFAPLFARLLERLDELEKQFGGGHGRAFDEVQHLRALAAQVEVRAMNTRWVEVFSGSSRRGQASPLSGFVGRAEFAAPSAAWEELLPWLLWGQLAQVGKGAVKGNGVMRIADWGLHIAN